MNGRRRCLWDEYVVLVKPKAKPKSRLPLGSGSSRLAVGVTTGARLGCFIDVGWLQVAPVVGRDQRFPAGICLGGLMLIQKCFSVVAVKRQFRDGWHWYIFFVNILL
jgi:hypothetical protein